MKKLIRNIMIAAAAALSVAGCRDDMPEMHNPMTNVTIYNWSQLFDAYWSGMNYNYVFWDIDPTDWDAVYREYKPRFDDLAHASFTDEAVNDSAVNMLESITADLIDGHYGIIIPQWTVGNDEAVYIIPASERIRQRPGYHDGNDTELYDKVLEKMISEQRLTNGFKTVYPIPEIGMDFNGVVGVVDNDIVYLKFNTFYFSMFVGGENPIDDLYDKYNDLLDNYPDVKGVVIDVRNNGGGIVDDIHLLLGKLVDERKTVFYTRMKNGAGRLDYTPWTPAYLEPDERTRSLDVPIVVLADMNSVSMAEMTTMAVKVLPNGVFIGERTFGGTGQLNRSNSAFENFYGGYFAIAGSIEVHTTMTMTKDVDGVNHEGVGVEPDIEEPYDGASLERGVDNQLERAIEYIHTGR